MVQTLTSQAQTLSGHQETDFAAKAREIVDQIFVDNEGQYAERAVNVIAAALSEAVAAETRRCIEAALERSAQVPSQNDFARGYAEGRIGAAAYIRKSRPLMTAPKSSTDV